MPLSSVYTTVPASPLRNALTLDVKSLPFKPSLPVKPLSPATAVASAASLPVPALPSRPSTPLAPTAVAMSFTLSNFAFASSDKPTITLPSSPVSICKPALAAVAVAAVPSPATKSKPFFKDTDLALSSATLLARYVIGASRFFTVTVASPKFTLPGSAGVVTVPWSSFTSALPGVTVIVLVPFLITKLSVPLPEIPFILVKVSANFTTKPFAFVVVSFSTRMFTPASVTGVVALGVKFFAPFTVNVVPNARSTAFASSPVKVNGCAANPFTVLIRVSNLETAAPTLLTVSVPPVASSFVMLYVGCVNAPLASTPALPPRAFAISCFAVCN